VIRFLLHDYSPTPPTAPSLRALVPSGSLIRFQSFQLYHHHPEFFFSNGGVKLSRVAGAPILPACLTPKPRVGPFTFPRGPTPPYCPFPDFPFRRGTTPPHSPVPHFPKPVRYPDCSLHKLQSERFPVEPT
jgi:hypothetical protein